MSNWFKQQRLEWIRESVQIYEYINREHIQRKFGVSVPQASADLRDAMKEWPLLMKYDTSSKAYVLLI